jgi:hypothetical protein
MPVTSKSDHGFELLSTWFQDQLDEPNFLLPGWRSSVRLNDLRALVTPLASHGTSATVTSNILS